MPFAPTAQRKGVRRNELRNYYRNAFSFKKPLKETASQLSFGAQASCLQRYDKDII
jgi:hypothetical protein